MLIPVENRKKRERKREREIEREREREREKKERTNMCMGMASSVVFNGVCFLKIEERERGCRF
jgi:hypothetical protein